MSGMTLRQLLAGIVDAPELPIRTLTLDSRRVGTGDLFVAIQGGTQHGLTFAATAVAAGAAAVLSDRAADTALGVPVLVVPDLAARLGDIATRFHGSAEPKPTLLGITGTNGKTSSVQLLAEAFTHAGQRAGTIGTLGTGLHGALVAGERTTPDVLATHAAIAAMRAAGAGYVAMEVSSHALDQGRVAGLTFAVAGFTNLTHDHLDYHGSMQAYAATKAALFRWPGLESAVINSDDDFGVELTRTARANRIITFSAAGMRDATLYADGTVTDARGLRFDLVCGTRRFVIQSALLGRFNVANLLLVAGVLLALDWKLADIASTLCVLRPVHGRMNRLGGDAAQPLIVVDYAHTPDALEKALSTLRQHTSGRLICVFGCGGDRDRGKRPIMGAIAERLADIAIITDDNPRSEDGAAIAAEVRAGMRTPARIERDRRTAIRTAIAMATAGDTVLIAGKGHEAYQEIKGVKYDFDDMHEAGLVLNAAQPARAEARA
jgi:UDP-N-acetylmuramoyl-L-alanyl-D-glutamate--2,6-diaminopimelate ligase